MYSPKQSQIRLHHTIKTMAKRTKSPKKNNKPSKKRRVDATTKTTSGKVDHQGGTASWTHRHFQLLSAGKLTLNYLKLTWGETGTYQGGFIHMKGGTLDITDY